jgi:hypothetical protein
MHSYTGMPLSSLGDSKNYLLHGYDVFNKYGNSGHDLPYGYMDANAAQSYAYAMHGHPKYMDNAKQFGLEDHSKSSDGNKTHRCEW